MWRGRRSPNRAKSTHGRPLGTVLILAGPHGHGERTGHLISDRPPIPLRDWAPRTQKSKFKNETTTPLRNPEERHEDFGHFGKDLLWVCGSTKTPNFQQCLRHVGPLSRSGAARCSPTSSWTFSTEAFAERLVSVTHKYAAIPGDLEKSNDITGNRVTRST